MRVLVLALFMLPLAAMEVPHVTTHHLMQAICQVETGCVWIAPGKVKGTWKEGRHGEVSPWQIGEAVLQDLRASKDDARRDPHFAEGLVLRRLAQLRDRGLDHRAVAAAYHRGYSGRHRADAKAYAERVVALAERLASEGK